VHFSCRARSEFRVVIRRAHSREKKLGGVGTASAPSRPRLGSPQAGPQTSVHSRRPLPMRSMGPTPTRRDSLRAGIGTGGEIATRVRVWRATLRQTYAHLGQASGRLNLSRLAEDACESRVAARPQPPWRQNPVIGKRGVPKAQVVLKSGGGLQRGRCTPARCPRGGRAARSPR